MDIELNLEHRAEWLEGLPLRGLAEFVLARLGLPDNTEVSVSFVTDERIAELNEGYRGVAGPTDVLSFECDGADDGWDSLGAPADATFLLGDVVIAPDVAQRQTQENQTTFEEEVDRLLVHGLLHLNGYDHQLDEEAAAMEALEGEILGSWAQRA